jgi:hypothetical protein
MPNQYTQRLPIYVIGPSIAYIPLTRNQYACVDWDDAHLVGAKNWYAHPVDGRAMFYARRKEYLGGHVSMHSYILGLSGSAVTADHKNRYGLDNRRANLRPATQAEQNANQGLVVSNTSGVRGVHYHPKQKLWRAQFKWRGKSYWVGTFSSKDSAVLAYQARVREVMGDFRGSDY